MQHDLVETFSIKASFMGRPSKCQLFFQEAHKHKELRLHRAMNLHLGSWDEAQVHAGSD